MQVRVSMTRWGAPGELRGGCWREDIILHIITFTIYYTYLVCAAFNVWDVTSLNASDRIWQNSFNTIRTQLLCAYIKYICRCCLLYFAAKSSHEGYVQNVFVFYMMYRWPPHQGMMYPKCIEHMAHILSCCAEPAVSSWRNLILGAATNLTHFDVCVKDQSLCRRASWQKRLKGSHVYSISVYLCSTSTLHAYIEFSGCTLYFECGCG